MAHDQSELAVVIGGCGFLGQHLVSELLDRGYKVSVFDVRKTFHDDRVERFYIGNVCNIEDLEDAFTGAAVVFHCASPAPASNDRQLFYSVNVDASEKVTSACRKCKVKRLVLTSSASVVFEGEDIKNGHEFLPYAKHAIDYYTETKIQQEQIILSSCGNDLLTVAVRPHGIFGPRDPHLVPTVVDAAKRGKMKFIIGDGNNLVDFTYVRNVVHGHICAAEALKRDSSISGHSYHITNDEPIKFWEFLGLLLSGLGYKEPRYHLPYWLILAVAWLLHFFVILLSPIVTLRPTFTPMRVALAGTFHYYDCSRAKKELGYQPLHSLQDGLRITLDHFKHLQYGNSK